MRRFFKNNRGMTLIELLVAITILGIVATPLLHGFLTSAKTEVKARKMGEVTSVAQNVMEIVEGNEFDDIVVGQITPAYRIFETATNNSVDERYYNYYSSYTLVQNNRRPNTEDYHIGLKNYKYAGKTYEVMLDIAATEYQQLNYVDELSLYSEMDKVFQIIPESEVIDTGYGPWRQIRLPNRTITIDVEEEQRGPRRYAVIEVSYQLDRNRPVQVETYEFEIRQDEVPSVYLLYHPSYTKYEGQYVRAEDTIQINNQDDIQFDLYIMKQHNANLSEVDLVDLEDEYVCNVTQALNNYRVNQGKIGAKIYTNLEENLGGSSREPEVTYTITYKRGNRTETANGTLNPFQTESETRKRIYKVTVQVFEEASNFTGEPVGTLTGAILK